MKAAPEPCKIEDCDNRGFGRGLCKKHFYSPDACVQTGCRRPATAGGKCARHQVDIPPGPRCTLPDCDRPRHRAGLCWRHYTKDDIAPCSHPTCTRRAPSGYCKTHAGGVDWAAGDWYDWAAVEQMWTGRYDMARQPTAPELREALRRCDTQGVTYKELACRMGVSEKRMQAWRQMLDRLAEVQGEAAA